MSFSSLTIRFGISQGMLTFTQQLLNESGAKNNFSKITKLLFFKFFFNSKRFNLEISERI